MLVSCVAAFPAKAENGYNTKTRSADTKLDTSAKGFRVSLSEKQISNYENKIKLLNLIDKGAVPASTEPDTTASAAEDKSDDPGRRNARNFAVM